MRGTRLWIAFGAMALAVTGFAPAAMAQMKSDPTIIARNILPSGQYGLPGTGASTQAEMYNALTPLFDHVSPNDLFTDYKSEKLSVDTDGPTTPEVVPFPGARHGFVQQAGPDTDKCIALMRGFVARQLAH